MFDILTIYPKCHRFHFFSRGICMYIPILTGIQNGHISRLKNADFLLKMFFLKLLFRDEGHLYANCLFYIPAIYPKCHLFQFYSRGISMYIPILTWVLYGRRSFWDSSHIFLKNILFEALFPRWRSPVCKVFVGYFDYWS